jgi:hypothetical protein
MLLALVVLGGGCTGGSAPQGSPSASTTASPSRASGGGPREGEVVFSDDFTDRSKGWDLTSTPGYTVRYGTGLEIEITQPGTRVVEPAPAPLPLLDVRVTALTFRTASPLATRLPDYRGVACRYSSGSYYLFGVNALGKAAILKKTPAGLERLTDWTANEVINPGDNYNQIRAVCLGKSLILFVNGREVLNARDPDPLPPGIVALVAQSAQKAGGQTTQFRSMLVERISSGD